MNPIDIDDIIALARSAGQAIMEVYDSDDVGLQIKDDDHNSPLTRADLTAHDIIVKGLEQLTPDIPVISEESTERDDSRISHYHIWLVDPLDGTKEFLKRNGQFTVNIALIEQGSPVLGVVYAPALDLLYFGDQDGAYKQSSGSEPEEIAVNLPHDDLKAAVSASHPSPELDDWLKAHGIAKTTAIGSSLKLCLIADGQADVYPRLAPTMEWDTAAGDAVVIAAGGVILSYPELQPLIYNKADLHNPHFVAASSRQLLS
ncbi:MAG TPA: 3'(2'),5'-bisphosphate nucleotidase CysQ [Candidatus Saccharimonadales bacterium]|nr:3'(2'),5'-bisphosphate nucleotidase CysQ [Candidatus Saccharimonadales bacterium]